MKVLLTLSLLLFFHCIAGQQCEDSYSAGRHTISISVGGRSRKFDFYVPYGRGNSISPAVFLFHGYGASPEQIDNKASLTSNAESAKWYGVMPSGSGLIRGWNGAGCCPGVTNDDVAFSLAIIEWLKSNSCVDENKIYAMGFSNGGFMIHRLACEASGAFAAFAPHSALLGTTFACNPANPVPIISFHGSADGVVPYFGNGNYDSFWDTMARWTDHNNCGGSENALELLKTSTTTCIRYDECDGGVPVEFCGVTGLAHDWSGNDSSRNDDIDATAYIFMFFQEVSVWTDHRLKAGFVKKPDDLNLDYNFSFWKGNHPEHD